MKTRERKEIVDGKDTSSQQRTNIIGLLLKASCSWTGQARHVARRAKTIDVLQSIVRK